MKNLLLLLFLLGYSLNTTAQTQLKRQIDQYFRQISAHSPAPGFAVVIVREKEVLFAEGYGQERIDNPRAMRPETVTAIGSLTKSMTALAILQLVEKGKVRLDAPVAEYLPAFHTANPNKSQKITVRMLLNNTSGLKGGVSQLFGRDGSKDLLSAIQAMYLDKEPGQTYEYANLAFSIAGLLIEQVSGLSYAEYLEEHIFQPLRMNRSSTDPADFEALQVLYGHHLGLSEAIPAAKEIELMEMAAAGSVLRSSAVDLGHYLIALLNEGKYQGQQVISSDYIQELWQPQISFPGLSYEQGGDGLNYHYGLGWMISEIEGRRLIHHGGSRGTMSSFTMLFPEKKLAAAILFNIDYNYADRYQYAPPFQMLNNLFHLMEQEPLSDFGQPRITDPTLNSFSLPSTEYERLTGEYRFSGKGDTRHFQGAKLHIYPQKNGKLAAKIYRGPELISHFELDFVNSAYAVSRNMAAPQKVQFKVRPDGTIHELFYAGSIFRKGSDAFRQKNEEVTIGTSRFYFPKGWNWMQQDSAFSAQRKASLNLYLKAGHINKRRDKAGLISTPADLRSFAFPKQTITFRGLEMTEVRGAHLWRQQSFRVEQEGRSLQQLVLLNETSGFYLIMCTSDGELTHLTQAIIAQLLDTYTEVKL